MTDKQLKASLIEAYNQQAEQRNKSDIEDWKAAERAYFLSLLQQENKRALLEIGAGQGRDSLFFQMQGLKVTSMDMSSAMTRLCQKKGISVCIMDMASLGFEGNSFHAVYALNSFLHLPKSEFPVALEHVCNVLRPAGLFYLGLYGGYDFEGIWDQDSYTPKRFFSLCSDENLKKFLVAYFEIIYFKNIRLGEGNRAFQSVILRKHAINKTMSRHFIRSLLDSLIYRLSSTIRC
jgi:SAM-dependent methyltransferase